MKFYLTVETQDRIKNTFLNLNLFYMLDIEQVICEYGLDVSKPHNKFLLSQEIEKIIVNQTKSKRIEGIIYINKNLNSQLVQHVYKLVKRIPKIDTVVILDDDTFPKLKDLYKIVDEVLFFPSVKRVKILECKTLVPFQHHEEKSDTLAMLQEAQRKREQ